MYLIEILLPLQDESRKPFPAEPYERRAPAEGRWKNQGTTERDDIVVIDVMAENIDRGWWSELRKNLMREFRQGDIVIRSQAIERLT